jgi:hypothetical protein
MRLFQNFSFWKTSFACQAASMLVGKPGLGPVFPRAWDKTNRVLEQARVPMIFMTAYPVRDKTIITGYFNSDLLVCRGEAAPARRDGARGRSG